MSTSEPKLKFPRGGGFKANPPPGEYGHLQQHQKIILILYLCIFYSHCQAYKKNCSQTQGHEATYLDKTIEFIDMTSKIVNIFDDRRPVSSLDDHRLATNHEVLDYLNRWEKDAEAHTELSKAERAKRLLSDKLRFDLSSMIIGFREVCRIAFEHFPGSTMSPFRTNSDLVENIFCQERGHNGQNSNPTYAQYGPTMNSIVLGQTTTTTSSNTGSVENLCFFKNGTFRSKKM